MKELPSPRICVLRLEGHEHRSAATAAGAQIKAVFDASGHCRDRRNIELHFRLSPAAFVLLLEATVPHPLHERCHLDGYSLQEFTGDGWRLAVKLINANMHNVLSEEVTDERAN